jgi:hypothetical protein
LALGEKAMNRVKWKITHDPLGLLHRTAALDQLEDAAREQGEDILQAQVGTAKKKEKILDLGWYADAYHVLLVAGDWSAPIDKVEVRDLKSAIAAFRRFMR